MVFNFSSGARVAGFFQHTHFARVQSRCGVHARVVLRGKKTGAILIIPGIQQMVKVGLRTVVMDVPSQAVIARDNV